MKRPWRFHKDVALDAQMVVAGMKFGPEAVANFAFRMRTLFPDGPDQALARAQWLSNRARAHPKDPYFLAVVAEADAIFDSVRDWKPG